jgi:SAM-dependent methyltransferase
MSASAFVRASLPPSPVRVLEIGAGDGALARELRRAGYDVVAIDPAPGGPDVLPVALDVFDAPSASFDAAVAVLSLHHVTPLRRSLARLKDLLRPGARLIVDEFDVDRFDERAADWWLEQRRRLRGGVEEKRPRQLVDELRSELHSLRAITTALRSQGFEVGSVRRNSYLYRWELDESLAALEEKLIAEQRLPQVGARFEAVLRADARLRRDQNREQRPPR